MFTTRDIALHLETAAAEKRLVTYSELAKAFPPMSKTFVPWPAHPLCEIFEQLDQEDSRNNLPFRTAIVVNAKTKMPGPGFFGMYKRLRRKSLIQSEQHIYWSGEVRDVYGYYSPR